MVAVSEPVNPGGQASYGAVILVNGVVDWESSGQIEVGPGEVTSNNVAEYTGFITVAQQLLLHYPLASTFIIRGDSNLVVQQLQGRWKIRGGHYVPYHYRAQVLWNALRAQCRAVTLEWIPRDQNGLADQLSKDVLRRAGVMFRLQPEEPG